MGVSRRLIRHVRSDKPIICIREPEIGHEPLYVKTTRDTRFRIFDGDSGVICFLNHTCATRSRSKCSLGKKEIKERRGGRLKSAWASQ